MPKKSFKILLSVVLLLFFSLPLFSQEERKVISYKDALSIFHSYSADIKIAKINKAISARDASVSSSWIPSIGVSSTLLSGAQAFIKDVDTSWAWSDYPTLSANATLSVSAANFTTIFASIVQNELADFTLSSTIKNLDMALYNTYSGLIASIEAVNVGEKSLNNAKTVLDNTQSRFDAGLVSSLELMNAKLSYSRAMSNFISLKNSRNSVYIALKNMLGVDWDFDVEEMNDLAFIALPSAAELYKKYLTTNSTLKPLELTAKATDCAFTTAATASLLPSFSASVVYNYNKNTNPATNSLAFTLQGRFSLDGFIPGTSTWQTISNAKDRSKIAKLNLETGYSTFRKEIESNMDNITSLEASYLSALGQVEAASESYRLTKDSYDKGNVSMSTLSNSMEALLSAEVALITANLNYKKAVYSFAVYLGDDFENFVKTYKK